VVFVLGSWAQSQQFGWDAERGGAGGSTTRQTKEGNACLQPTRNQGSMLPATRNPSSWESPRQTGASEWPHASR
jgi:hypothetical protein